MKKKNGKYRTITAPCEELKAIQRSFADSFDAKFGEAFTNHITGFRKGFSIKDNAEIHLAKKWVINLDLKDFFPSISKDVLSEMFERIGVRKYKGLSTESLLEVLTLEDRLPQGSPASPVLANFMAIESVDKIVLNLLEVLGLDFEYTRYADDLTFSSNEDLDRNRLNEIVSLMVQKIEEANIFKVAMDKIKISNQGQRQEVTGIVVNKIYSVKKKERMRLRAAIHQIKLGNKVMTPQLQGKLSFIHQVNPELFNKLTKELK